MRGIHRLALLLTVTTAAFAFAIGRFESAARDGCAQRAGTDRSYRVVSTAVTAPPAGRAGRARRADGARGGGGSDADPPPTTYVLGVARDGRPVSGAAVCISAYMRGMPAMAVVGHATETTPGTYLVTVDHPMEGEWTGRVVVDEPGRPASATALDLVAG